MRRLLAVMLLSLPFAAVAQGARVVQFNLIDERGLAQPIGRIAFEDTRYGLLISPSLNSLPPGVHGFHMHENPSCAPGREKGEVKPGLAAGGHYDPDRTRRHRGPYRDDGHKGDLPVLYVDEKGNAEIQVLAPRLKLRDFRGRSVMIHAGGDNYLDEPHALGGGGGRIACAVW
ncbi:MAG: superoxide dismutase family protein [Thiohalomonadaceae bacterium]